MLNFTMGGTAGPHVLLLHGIPGSQRTWKGVAAQLANRHRVLSPDLLGFGSSPRFHGDGHADEQAKKVLSLLDDQNIDQIHVTGFDFGGPVAVMLYRHAPERVLSLTLSATNLFTDTPVPVPLRIARVPLVGDGAFRLFFGRAGLAMMWVAATGDRARFRYADFAAALSPLGIRSTQQIFLRSLRDLQKYYADIEATLPNIAVPVSVVWGDRDPFFPVAIGRRLASAIPDARFHVLAGCGHFVPGERSDELAAIIEKTVAQGVEAISQRSSKTAKSR